MIKSTDHTIFEIIACPETAHRDLSIDHIKKKCPPETPPVTPRRNPLKPLISRFLPVRFSIQHTHAPAVSTTRLRGRRGTGQPSHRRPPSAIAAASIAASACRARRTLVSRCRFDRIAARARTTSAHSLPLRYSPAYCHEIRNHRRILSSGETGRSTDSRLSTDRSSND